MSGKLAFVSIDMRSILKFAARVANRDTTLPNPDPNGPRVFIPERTA